MPTYATKAGPFRRELSDDRVIELCQEIGRALQTDIQPSAAQIFISFFRETEERMIGRIAGDIDDHLLNYFMRFRAAQSISADRGAHLETGALFGGSFITTVQAVMEAGANDTVITIDPFSGYYGKTVDPITDVPVTRENVEENLRRMRLDHRPTLIVEASSSDPRALEAIAPYDIKSVWIDGDHSYSGVKHDWEWYASRVRQEGYVLIDNYRDQAWPEVTDFVDREVRDRLKDWRVTLEMGRSIVFQKIS